MASVCALLKGCGSQNINQALCVDKKTLEKLQKGNDRHNMVKRSTDAIRLPRTMDPAHKT